MTNCRLSVAFRRCSHKNIFSITRRISRRLCERRTACRLRFDAVSESPLYMSLASSMCRSDSTPQSARRGDEALFPMTIYIGNSVRPMSCSLRRLCHITSANILSASTYVSFIALSGVFCTSMACPVDYTVRHGCFFSQTTVPRGFAV